MSQFLLTQKDASGVVTPTGNKHVFFMDTTTGHLMSKNSAGQLTEYKPLSTTQELHSQFVTVGQPGDSVDFTSIKAAVDSITDASASMRYAVLVYPGNYTENPFTVPEYVVLVTTGERTVNLSANNVDHSVVDFITMQSNTAMSYFDLIGPTNAACITDGNTVSAPVYVEDCLFISGAIGVHARTAGSQVFVEEVKMEPAVGIGCLGDASSFVGVSSGFIRAGIAIKCDAGEMALQNNYFGGLMTGTGIWALNGALINSGNQTISYRATGAQVTGGAKIHMTGANFTNNTEDLKQDDANSIFTGTGITLDQDKITAVKPSNIKIMFMSGKIGDEALHIRAELAVGSAGSGREAVFGGGDSYTNGRLIYDYNGSTFTQVPSALDKIDTITHTLGTASGNALYMASNIQDDSDYVKGYGFKMTVVSPAVIGSGEYVIEYWNGAWTEVNYMVKDSGGEYIARGKTLFEQSQSVQVRLDDAMRADWVKSDPMSYGTNLFWFRIRTVTAVTTAAAVEQIKLHTDRLEINSDGFEEYFGQARPVVRLPFDWGSMEAANDSPSNIDHYVGENLCVGRQENSFEDGATDRAGLNAFLPFEIDTSCPIRLRWAVQCTNSGTIEWVVRWAATADGDSVYDTANNSPTDAVGQQSITVDQVISGADQQDTIEVELDISEFLPERENGFGDMLWVTIQRNGNTDAMNGNVNIIQLVPFYTRCAIGGHQ